MIERLPVLAVETVSMTTRDGARLDADVYRPAGAGRHPVLLMRQAYGRRVACTICYAHPSWYASHGYIVVVQDVRGRGSSEGFFQVGEHEREDGAETIEWAARLPGSTGAVGMYGFSYQGFNQLQAATAVAPSLKALAPAMTPWDAREGWSHTQGALRLQGTLGWATQLAADTARHEGDVDAYAALMAAARSLPLSGRIPARPDCMQRFARYSHYFRWLDTPADDSYWRDLSPATHIGAILEKRVPMLFVAGWYDTFLETTIDAWRALALPGHAPVQLVVGPWLHFPWTRKVGAQDFGPEADGGLDALHVRWFDRWLKGRENGVDMDAPVRLFDMGSRAWHGFAAWPQRPIDFALHGSGRVSVDARDGLLLEVVPDEAGSPDEGDRADWPDRDTIVMDPWRPTPSVGGAFGTPAGPVDRSGVDARTDVATFTTPPLPGPFAIAGDVAALLYVDSDVASIDLSCTLSRVLPDGAVIPLTDGYRHIRSRTPDAPVRVAMQSTCVTLAPGDALRLSVAAAAFPAYPVNPGNGQRPGDTPALHAQAVTLSILHSAVARSVLTVNVPLRR